MALGKIQFDGLTLACHIFGFEHLFRIFPYYREIQEKNYMSIFLCRPPSNNNSNRKNVLKFWISRWCNFIKTFL